MNIFLLLLWIYCLTEEKAVTANEKECSSRNETEAGGYFRLDVEKARFGCIKRIKVNRGFYIKMSFGPSKNNTEVEVVEFSDGTKSIFKKLDPNPVMYESQENEIEVRIYDYSASLDVQWRRECGKSHYQASKLFEVKGPSLPSDYPNHSKCNWEVSSPSEYQIMLEVQEIRAYNQTLGDCSYDYVQVTGILEGETRSTTTCLTEGTSKYYYNSPVYILFYSDNNSGSGISFKFRTSLVKFLREYKGRIKSPGYPSGYPNSSSQAWILEAPMGFRIQLTFDDFQLEKEHNGKCYDCVKIIESGQADVNNMERSYCGTSMANSTSTSGKQRMEVLFASDQGVEDKGFTAYWVTVCGGTFDGNSGELIGPNNASGYPEKQTCTWNIRVQNGYRLLLTLNVNGYNDQTNCSLDHIQVDEEQSEHGINGGRFCSGSITLQSTKSVTIVFRSDNDPTTGLSFNASWLSKCSETFDSDSGELASPDNPVNYDHEVRCNWTIRVLPGHAIVISYRLPKTSNDETPCKPYVQVTETDSSASKILCNSNTFAVHRSSSNTLHISFTHEPGMNYTRFYAKWLAEDARMHNKERFWLVSNTEVGIAESSNGSTQAPFITLQHEDRKVKKSSPSVADVILQTAAPPVAFVIFIVFLVLLVRRAKSMWRFSKQNEEVTNETEGNIYDSINERDTKVEHNKPQINKNGHFLCKNRFEPQNFRRRLPNPPTGRFSAILARVRNSMQFRNDGYDTAHDEPTERKYISFIDQTQLHECKQEVSHSKQERFIQGIESTTDSFRNAGYISADNVDQVKRKCVCSRNIVENDCVDIESTVETMDNEGYLTAVDLNSSATERSPSTADSYSIKSRVDIHCKEDKQLNTPFSKTDSSTSLERIRLDEGFQGISMDAGSGEIYRKEALKNDTGPDQSSDSYLTLQVYLDRDK